MNDVFDIIIDELSYHWDMKPYTDKDSEGPIRIISIPYHNSTYDICFSLLKDDLALMVTKVIADTSNLGAQVFINALKCNSLLSTLTSTFFMYEDEREVLSMYYQDFFPYKELMLDERIMYIEDYLEGLCESMKSLNVPSW